MKPSRKPRQRRKVISTLGKQVETEKPLKETEKKQLERWKEKPRQCHVMEPKRGELLRK